MAAPSRLSAGARSTALLGCLAALGLPLAGCAPADPEPDIPEMEQPPNREISEPGLVAGAELPVWARSADCDQPRPSAEDDGLSRTAPAPDAADVGFVVPQAELSLCELPGVVSASVEGSYTQEGEAREGGRRDKRNGKVCSPPRGRPADPRTRGSGWERGGEG